MINHIRLNNNSIGNSLFPIATISVIGLVYPKRITGRVEPSRILKRVFPSLIPCNLWIRHLILGIILNGLVVPIHTGTTQLQLIQFCDGTIRT